MLSYLLLVRFGDGNVGSALSVNCPTTKDDGTGSCIISTAESCLCSAWPFGGAGGGVDGCTHSGDKEREAHGWSAPEFFLPISLVDGAANSSCPGSIKTAE